MHRATDAAKLAKIKSNLAYVKQSLLAEQIIILKQIHSTIVVDADNIVDFDTQIEGDGLVTTKPAIALGIVTADCVPVLLSANDGTVVGAAHCGWKSAKDNIIANVIKLMRKKGANLFKVVMGPAISQKSYEVDEERYQDCLKADPLYEQFFKSSKRGHYLLDIPGMIIWQLRKQHGINDILHINEDTYTNPVKYPSHRRSQHQGEQNAHNILSTIMIG